MNCPAGPLNADLPTNGETAITSFSFNASSTPSRDMIGLIEVIGFDGPKITLSDFSIASIILGLGFTSPYFTSRTSQLHWYLIKKSWNSISPYSFVAMVISDSSSLIGNMLALMPNLFF